MKRDARSRAGQAEGERRSVKRDRERGLGVLGEEVFPLRDVVVTEEIERFLIERCKWEE